MNASRGEPPYEPAANPGSQGAAHPLPPPDPARGGAGRDGPGPGAAPPVAGQIPAGYAAHGRGGAVAAPPAYPADQAFAPGNGLHWSPISKRHTWHRLTTAVLWAIPVGALGAFLVWRNGGGAVAAAMWLAALALVVVLAGLMAEMGRRSLGYAERGDDLIVTHGVLVKRLIVVPYGRMQFVDVTAGLLERWMGIATVRMHTAAAATDATIPGLPATEAGLLRDRLAQKGEERSMGL
ncbi:PH domain-containing protein [Actinomadura sp. NEAU-AAG5]|uniref:PH domain-containing protein n=1 Tax=Actinomadura litoris TaxID=2678616 RepID=A0A7K1KTV0_9ACTN|nr:PH domain-containing protein [Actinomadura litoris]